MEEKFPYRYQGKPEKLHYPETFPMPSEKERDRRWGAIRGAMQRHGFDCLIVGTTLGYMPMLRHLHYISNYVPAANLGTYVVFPLEGEPQLGVNNMLGYQFRHIAGQTSWIDEVVGSLSPVRDILNKIKKEKLEKGKIGLVGCGGEGASLMNIVPTVYDVLKEGFPEATIEGAMPVMVEAMNQVSRESDEEVALLRKACEIMDLSFEAVAAAMKPGNTECDLWAAAEHAIIKHGGWNANFMLGACGPAPTFLRAPASHHTLAVGDVAVFEINVTYGGVSPQVAYALSLGRPRPDVMAMYDFCMELYDYSLEGLGKGMTYNEVERELVRRIQGAGYELMTPQIHGSSMSEVMMLDMPPQPGDCFIVHTNVCNRDFTAGAKFGDAVLVNKDGKLERLQKIPPQLNIIEP